MCNVPSMMKQYISIYMYAIDSVTYVDTRYQSRNNEQ